MNLTCIPVLKSVIPILSCYKKIIFNKCTADCWCLNCSQFLTTSLELPNSIVMSFRLQELYNKTISLEQMYSFFPSL